MITELKNIQISAIATAVPKQQKNVFEYCKDFLTEREIRRMIKNTGFTCLRIADESTTIDDLCFAAAEHLIQHLSIDRNEMDGIVFVSQTSAHVLPAASHILQSRLQLTSDCIAIDVNQGCSGYVYGLNLAAQLVQTGQCRKVLLCVGDTSSKFTGSEDRTTRPLFGDAGSATIVEQGKSEMIFNFNTFGEQYRSIFIERYFPNEDHKTYHGNFLSMDGMAVLNFTLNEVPDNLQKLLSYVNLAVKDIPYFIMHQASRFILTSLRDKLGLTQEQMPFRSETIGNTSSASIPITLRGGGIKPDSMVLCGFGVGLSVASVFVDLSKTVIVDFVEV